MGSKHPKNVQFDFEKNLTDRESRRSCTLGYWSVEFVYGFWYVTPTRFTAVFWVRYSQVRALFLNCSIFVYKS